MWWMYNKVSMALPHMMKIVKKFKVEQSTKNKQLYTNEVKIRERAKQESARLIPT